VETWHDTMLGSGAEAPLMEVKRRSLERAMEAGLGSESIYAQHKIL